MTIHSPARRRSRLVQKGWSSSSVSLVNIMRNIGAILDKLWKVINMIANDYTEFLNNNRILHSSECTPPNALLLNYCIFKVDHVLRSSVKVCSLQSLAKSPNDSFKGKLSDLTKFWTSLTK